jgi:hypothetical protein
VWRQWQVHDAVAMTLKDRVEVHADGKVKDWEH